MPPRMPTRNCRTQHRSKRATGRGPLGPRPVRRVITPTRITWPRSAGPRAGGAEGRRGRGPAGESRRARAGQCESRGPKWFVGGVGGRSGLSAGLGAEVVCRRGRGGGRRPVGLEGEGGASPGEGRRGLRAGPEGLAGRTGGACGQGRRGLRAGPEGLAGGAGRDRGEGRWAADLAGALWLATGRFESFE